MELPLSLLLFLLTVNRWFAIEMYQYQTVPKLRVKSIILEAHEHCTNHTLAFRQCFHASNGATVAMFPRLTYTWQSLAIDEACGGIGRPFSGLLSALHVRFGFEMRFLLPSGLHSRCGRNASDSCALHKTSGKIMTIGGMLRLVCTRRITDSIHVSFFCRPTNTTITCWGFVITGY